MTAPGSGRRPQTRAIAVLGIAVVIGGLAMALITSMKSGTGVVSLAKPTPVAGASTDASPAASSSGLVGLATLPPADASIAAATATPAPTSTARPTRAPTPAPTLNMKPAIATFTVPTTVNCGGYNDAIQIQIPWKVDRATGASISIDGPGIFTSENGTSGSFTVPFACGAADAQHSYTLTTIGGTGSPASVTKTVKRIG